MGVHLQLYSLVLNMATLGYMYDIMILSDVLCLVSYIAVLDLYPEGEFWQHLPNFRHTLGHIV